MTIRVLVRRGGDDDDGARSGLRTRTARTFLRFWKHREIGRKNGVQSFLPGPRSRLLSHVRDGLSGFRPAFVFGKLRDTRCRLGISPLYLVRYGRMIVPPGQGMKRKDGRSPDLRPYYPKTESRPESSRNATRTDLNPVFLVRGESEVTATEPRNEGYGRIQDARPLLLVRGYQTEADEHLDELRGIRTATALQARGQLPRIGTADDEFVNRQVTVGVRAQQDTGKALR